MSFKLKKLVSIILFFISTSLYAQTQTSPGSAFQNFCENIDTFHPMHRLTLSTILQVTKEQDCKKSSKILANLENFASIGFVTTLLPFSDLTQLKGLYLYQTLASDTEELKNLRSLKFLALANYFKYEKVQSDISVLKNLTNLEVLNLTGFPITDYKVIGLLKNIKSIKLDGHNDVTDLDFLSNLDSLDEFSLQCTDLFKDIVSARDLTSPHHIVGTPPPPCLNTSLKDISALSKFKGLKLLNLNSQFIQDISFIKELKSLQVLKLDLVPILDFSPLENLPLLFLSLSRISQNKNPTLPYRKKLGLYKKRNYSPVYKLKSLENLNVAGSHPKELIGIKKLTSLNALDISSDILPKNLIFLKGLSNLTYLVINSTTKNGHDLLDVNIRNRSDLEDISILKEFKSLRVLWLRGHKIKNISSLTELKELADLNLSHNFISNIDPLSELTKLRSLAIDRLYNSVNESDELQLSKPITDINALSRLTRLNVLSLENQGIKTIIPLMSLAGLRVLKLSGNNKISNIEAVRNMAFLNTFSFSCMNVTPHLSDPFTQKKITPCDNPILEDISPLKNLAWLSYIDLKYNNIKDLSHLRNLSQIRLLKINGNKITNIKPLSDLFHISGLDISDNLIEDLRPIANHMALSSLNAARNPVRLWPNLKDQAYLMSLDLSSTGLKDLSIISKNGKLDTLNLYDNNISDLSPLNRLQYLSYIDITDNNIESLDPLNNSKQLEIIKARNNNISDISSLRLPSLITLFLNGNSISDISNLRSMQRLLTLGIDDNLVSDLTPLRFMTSLMKFTGEGNPIKIESCPLNSSVEVLNIFCASYF
ncbi:hypothetical protein A9Q84_17040 [Halobacteriovorax marinus]|uniref:Uncharacterized protein n=1 Tax=Halobacteriovorax marinus TaxID=97084 RepID=A0A1Y5F8Z9_9BACT|nr:hypothetical protein A9Q84_17040 [Halobacteriovorax marinus]